MTTIKILEAGVVRNEDVAHLEKFHDGRRIRYGVNIDGVQYINITGMLFLRVK
jgi:hypothetical protein